MKRYVFLGILFIIISSCKKEDDIVETVLAPECLGENMIGTWSVIDSVEMIFLDVDSFDYKVYQREIVLYEDGIGNLIIPNFSNDYFFRWILQCDPNIFTMSIPFSNQDSLFIPLELHTVSPYKILINELEYKKMIIETTGSINQFNQTRITKRDLIKL